MTKDIIEIYLKTGSFNEAVKLSGLHPLEAHLRLMKSGALKIKDKIEYGDIRTKRGARAEALFQELVPTAIDANKCWQRNNPRFDFMYKNMTIDVKFSSCFRLRNDKKHMPKWSFKANTEADFFVLFAEHVENEKEETKLDKAYCFLIPNGFIKSKYYHISLTNDRLWKLNIDRNDLKKYLDEYAEIMGDYKEMFEEIEKL